MTNPIPEGYHTVTPYFIAEDAERLIAFVKAGFGAQENYRMEGPDGSVAHAELRIGDSMVMVGQASEQFPAMPTMIYLYVEDTDATYRSAVDAGGTSVEEPADQFYGDRRAAVSDPVGNHWYIATNKEVVTPEEMERRVAAQEAP